MMSFAPATCGVLEASQDIGIYEVACDSNGKDIADALVEH
jgi:hypothetical protein